MLDRTTTIRASVKDVERSLMLSVCLVVAVVFVFLRSPRATLIPAVAVPVSLIGTFAVMYLFHYSLDNLSLMALTISTGFVVDDAIVVMENISRHIENGMAPYAAALLGPADRLHRLLHQRLADRRIHPHFADGRHRRTPLPRIRDYALHRHRALDGSLADHDAHHVRAHASNLSRRTMAGPTASATASSPGLLGFYRRSLLWVLDHPALTLTTLALVIALNVVVVVVIPKGFFPQQDTGIIFGGMQGPQDASFAVMDDSVRRLLPGHQERPRRAKCRRF